MLELGEPNNGNSNALHVPRWPPPFLAHFLQARWILFTHQAATHQKQGLACESVMPCNRALPPGQV